MTPTKENLSGRISPLKSTQAKSSVLCSFFSQHLPIAANKPTSLTALKRKVTETADIASGINLSYYPSSSFKSASMQWMPGLLSLFWVECSSEEPLHNASFVFLPLIALGCRSSASLTFCCRCTFAQVQTRFLAGAVEFFVIIFETRTHKTARAHTATLLSQVEPSPKYI